MCWLYAYVMVWTQLAKSEWAIHACAHITLTHYQTNLTYTRLFFYYRIIDDEDGYSHTGGNKRGRWNGKGERVWVDGSREIAYWVDNKKEGAAKYYDENGNEEDRFYKNDELVEQ